MVKNIINSLFQINSFCKKTNKKVIIDEQGLIKGFSGWEFNPKKKKMRGKRR